MHTDNLASGNILLVDDNPYDVELMIRELKRSHLDARIVVARDGVEALDYLHHRGKYAQSTEAKPMLILLDTHLPKLSGLEVLRHIRADKQFKDIPVLVLTGSQNDQLRKEYESLGILDFVEKPINLRTQLPILSYIGLDATGNDLNEHHGSRPPA